jgi:hypothetical protein
MNRHNLLITTSLMETLKNIAQKGLEVIKTVYGIMM